MTTLDAQHKEPKSRSVDVITAWPDTALVDCVCDTGPYRQEALGVLLARHYPWALRRCRLQLGNLQDAEDAAQEILLRAYQNLNKFQGRAPFKSWFNTITDNYCHTLALRRARHFNPIQMARLLDTYEQEQEDVDPYSAILEKEAVHKALNKLPENARIVLSLRFYSDHSLEDIADLLSLTLSATKARLYRAIEQFKQVYFRLFSDSFSSCA